MVPDSGDDSLLRAVAAAPEVSIPADLATLVLLEPGTVVDGVFRIEERLGAGGMGVVYAARDLVLDREVALKLMRAGHRRPGVFEREARATARLNHPNIVTLHQFGDWNGLLYLVLERLRGETLARRLDRGGLPLGEGLAVIEQVVRALVHTHGAGIVHRDLKPQNVFLLDGGGVKVLDFGVSGLSIDPAPPPAEGGADRAATTLSRAGTPGYMAPEQWRGQPQDAGTDLWAVGVMLHQLVAGALPFGVTPVSERASPPPLADHLPAEAAALAPLVTRCLTPRREDRLADAAALADTLRTIRDRLDSAGAATTGPGGVASIATARARPRRRRRALVAAGGLALGAIVIAAVTGSGGAGAPPPLELPAGPVRSVVTVGGPGKDIVQGAAEVDGDVVIAGHVGHGATLGGVRLQLPVGSSGGFVARVGGDGEVRWRHTVDGPFRSSLAGVVAGRHGDVLVAGQYRARGHFAGAVLDEPDGESDCFVASLDASTGALRWLHRCGATGVAAARSLDVDGDGNIYVGGEFGGRARFGGATEHDAAAAPQQAPFVASWAPDGTLRWVTAGRRTANARGYGLAVAEDAVIAALWVLGAGQIGDRALDAGGCVIARFDRATGAVRWLHEDPGEAGLCRVHDVAITGDRVAAGGVQHGKDGGVWAAELDLDDGAVRWWRAFAAGADNRVKSLTYARDGALLVGGMFTSSFSVDGVELAATSEGDVFVLAFDRDGRAVGGHQLGGQGGAMLRWIGESPAGGLWLAGRFEPGLELGGHRLATAGGYDGFLVELSPAAWAR